VTTVRASRTTSTPPRRGESYLKLPYDFWLAEWHRRLDLPSVAVLLIGLSLNDGFVLPGEHVRSWYGVSPSTLTKGLTGLRRQGLIDVRRDQKAAPLAPEGHTWEYTYTLKPPFGPKGRRAQTRADMIKRRDLERHLRLHGCERLREVPDTLVGARPSADERPPCHVTVSFRVARLEPSAVSSEFPT
jgi:hypothetical protein